MTTSLNTIQTDAGIECRDDNNTLIATIVYRPGLSLYEVVQTTLRGVVLPKFSSLEAAEYLALAIKAEPTARGY